MKKRKKIVLHEVSFIDFTDGMQGAVERGLIRFHGSRVEHAVQDEAVRALQVRPTLKKKTPVRDYLRMAAIVLVAAALGIFGIRKLEGPPAKAIYQVRSGMFNLKADYTSEKPNLLQQGCVFWLDLEGRGNIFCGDFVIAEVPGRIPVTPQTLKKAEAPKK